MNDLASRFVNKQRVVKEKQSMGGFRIPQESLKKRTNPSDYMSTGNPQSAFSFNPYGSENNSMYMNKVTCQPHVPLKSVEDFAIDPNEQLSSNLIHIIDKEVEKLKRESDDYLRSMETSKNSLQRMPELEENKVYTDYLSYNPDRVQAIKHVTTQFKPEYTSLEDLQRMKEEHMQNLLKIENEYFEKKRKADSTIDRFSRQDSEYRMVNESHKITSGEIEAILQHEREYFQNEKHATSKGKKARPKSAQRIKRQGMDGKPLDKDGQRYVKKYMNYLAKNNRSDDEDEEDWNKTKIKSQNVNGVVNRPDNLPGHIDREDYSLYYCSIGSSTPKSLSVKSFSRSRSKSATNKNRRKTGTSTIKKNKSQAVLKQQKPSWKKLQQSVKTQQKSQPQSVQASQEQKGIQSHIAFIKWMFRSLDKEGAGYIPKVEVLRDMKLDEQIINELGFEGEDDFVEVNFSLFRIFKILIQKERV